MKRYALEFISSANETTNKDNIMSYEMREFIKGVVVTIGFVALAMTSIIFVLFK